MSDLVYHVGSAPRIAVRAAAPCGHRVWARVPGAHGALRHATRGRGCGMGWHRRASLGAVAWREGFLGRSCSEFLIQLRTL